MKKHHRPVAAYRRLHRIRQQQLDRSELELLRKVFTLVIQFDPDIASKLKKR